MAIWIVAGWCLLAVALAAIHHRLQRRGASSPAPLAPATARFLQRFETQLAAHPNVEYRGLLPGQFACLLRVDGQDTPVSLHELYRRCEAFPESLAPAVASLVGEIVEFGLDRLSDHDFATVATSILPQVRSRSWIEPRGRFGDAALVHRPLTEDLAVVYVIDDPQSMVFVCRGHLRQWCRTIEDVHHLAVANLRRLGALESCVVDAGSEPVLLQSGDGYDAARVLLLEPADGLLVALPDRDLLWIASPAEQDLRTLSEAVASTAGAAANPISERLYRLRDGCLEPLAGA